MPRLFRIMKYLKQFCIILLFTVLGEALHALLPLPVPAAIYGLVLLFLALLFRLIRPEAIRETSGFLVSLLPLLFVAPLVGLAASFDLIRGDILVILLIIVVGLVLTFGVSGAVVQGLLNRRQK